MLVLGPDTLGRRRAKEQPPYLSACSIICANAVPATVIHLVLDNYKIHDSKIVQAALQGCFAGRIKLHFLPPYCPKYNRIERVWKDLHDNVTRNHTCKTIDHLMQKVRDYLHRRNRHSLMNLKSRLNKASA